MGKYTLLTKNTYKKTVLKESQIASIDEFIDNIKVIIKTLGYSVLDAGNEQKYQKLILHCKGNNSSAKDEICELFGRRDYFSTPKPIKLMEEFVRMTTDKNSVVMDFFAGSGTVGHAVMDLNKEDGGTRTFILVSNNESNICKNVTVKRMEKAGAKFVLLD